MLKPDARRDGADIIEDARALPAAAAPFLAAFGGVYGVLCLLHWALTRLFAAGLIQESTRVESEMIGANLAHFTFLLVFAWILWRNFVSPPRRTSRIAGAAASALAFALLSILGSATAFALRTHDAIALTLIPSVLFALYGALWSATALIARNWAAGGVAAGALLAPILAAFAAPHVDAFLIWGFALLLLFCLPGLLLMRKAAAPL